MSHQVKRCAPVPANLECPLASLGRNSSAVMDTLAGHHHQASYHHPLSPSPLDPQVYQMSRKSPDFSMDADDDIIYTSTQQSDGLDGRVDRVGGCLDNREESETTSSAAVGQRHGTLTDMYQLSRSSTPSSIGQPPLTASHKAGTFELRCRHGFNDMNMASATNSASMSRSVQHQRAAPAQQRNFLALDHLLQYDTNGSTDGVARGGGGGNNADTEDSDAGKSRSRINRHLGGRCSVPTVSSPSAQYYLEKKMDSLYLGSAMRGLPLGAEASNHFQNDRFYMEDGLRNVCGNASSVYSNGNELVPEPHQLHHRVSSASETSGSDRYLLNRTNSPANVFSSSQHLDDFSSSNNNTSSSNLALDQRFRHSNGKSLSDGLCNLGRFSPSLDQGYATLVSPSPTTGHHPNVITTHSIVHHSATPPSTSMLTAAARRHAVDNGPPPWNKKGPFRSGPYFDHLPDEAVVKIFSWLDSCELCRVARTCRRFEQLAWRPVLWKVISLKGEHLNGDKALKMIFRQLCGQTRNGSCPEVERVLLADGCRITDKSLQLLTRRCPELTHLQLQLSVNVSNQALMDALTKCTNLQHLDVTGCTEVVSICPNPNFEPQRRLLLQYLDLTDCIAIDDVGLKIIVKNCPQLVYLYLRRCAQITDAGLKFVPSFCVTLKELSISDCVNITDFGLYELAKLGAALRYLSVAKCDRVSDAGLKVIARRCYKLRYLNARGCEAVSDDSITVLARSCPRLRALDIGKCDVSDAGLRALAESCPNLKKLSLRSCDMITDRGVQCIAYYCRGLQQLNIQDCQVSIEGYRAVKKYCKRCIIEHTNPGFC